MSNCNIKIPDALYERLKASAKEKGYSSAEEMILHILEKTVAGDLSGIAHQCQRGEDEAKTETVKRQLKGLGYFNG